jgi:hypothetical protein
LYDDGFDNEVDDNDNGNDNGDWSESLSLWFKRPFADIGNADGNDEATRK